MKRGTYFGMGREKNGTNDIAGVFDWFIGHPCSGILFFPFFY